MRPRGFRQRSGNGDTTPNLHDRILRTNRAPRRGVQGATRHVRRRVVAGLLAFLPILVTYFVFRFFYDIIDSLLDPFIRRAGIPHGPGIDVMDIVEIIIILVILYIVGLLIGWAVTKLFIDRLHDAMGRIPIIGPVYHTTRQGIDFLSNTQQQSYRGVVLLEFPRLGVLSIGLITSNLGELNGTEEYLSIYVPTTPVPSSGYLVIVPASKVTPTDISVEEAMRMIISGGILAGDIFTNRVVMGNDSSWPGRDWLWGGPNGTPEAAGTGALKTVPATERTPAGAPQAPD